MNRKKISFSNEDHKEAASGLPYYEFTVDQKVAFGLLKRKKTYQTRLLIEDVISPETVNIVRPLDEDLEILPKALPNNLLEITIRLYTRRSGNYEESFQLVSPHFTVNQTYIVTATIMGKDRGTPMLKSSVFLHSNKPKGDDSEDSDEETDWGGFN